MLPSFAMPLVEIEGLLTEGRDLYGHPGSWDGTPDVEPEVDELLPEDPPRPRLCSLHLHPRTKANTEPNGECRGCRNIRRKRRRSADNGKPLCWRGEHPQPAVGEVCPCGDVPPEETFIDWVVVERAVNGLPTGRIPTKAEELCAITTVAKRYNLGPYAAAAWLNRYGSIHYTGDDVRNLFYHYLPENGGGLTANEVFAADMTTAAA